jgi:hypothetical protein
VAREALRNAVLELTPALLPILWILAGMSFGAWGVLVVTPVGLLSGIGWLAAGRPDIAGWLFGLRGTAIVVATIANIREYSRQGRFDCWPNCPDYTTTEIILALVLAALLLLVPIASALSLGLIYRPAATHSDR